MKKKKRRRRRRRRRKRKGGPRVGRKHVVIPLRKLGFWKMVRESRGYSDNLGRQIHEGIRRAEKRRTL
jgi:hypothetical protein